MTIPEGPIWDITQLLFAQFGWLLDEPTGGGTWSPFEGQAPTGGLGVVVNNAGVVVRNGITVAAALLRNIYCVLYIYTYIYIYMHM